MKKFGIEDVIITIENNELIVKNKYFKIYYDYSLVEVGSVYTEYSIISRLSPFSGGSRHFVLVTKQGLKTTLFNYHWLLWANNGEICDQINAEIKEFAVKYNL